MTDWQVIEGDCLDVMRGMADGSVDAVITDPPYNVVDSQHRSDRKGFRVMRKGVADTAPINIPRLAREFSRISAGSIYVWCGSEQVSAWRAELVSLGLTTRQCVWVKTNPSPIHGQRFWLSGVELCVYARKPKAPFFLHCKVPAWTGPTQRVKDFPAPKPLWLMRTLIDASVPDGGSVFDPFAGSGSTGVAAVELGRRFIGVEIEPEYAAIARNRIAATQPALCAVAD